MAGEFLVRSILFVPAVQPRFIEKAPSVAADAICLDLEDSVPLAEKERARELAAGALTTLSGERQLLLVRVNSLDSGLLERDLAAVVAPQLYGISLPKAHTPEIIKHVDAALGQLERERDMAEGHVKIIPWIESSLAVWQAYPVCAATPRLVGAAFGAEDFTADMGIPRTKESFEIAWARAAVAVAARAAGILPIGVVVTDFNDDEYLERDCRLERSLGYRAKFCIHPRQVETVNRVFGPDKEEIEQAKRVIQAYEEAERRGLGALSLNDEMIDRPVYVRARRLLDWAAAIDHLRNISQERDA